jgi:hypothetical protein
VTSQFAPIYKENFALLANALLVAGENYINGQRWWQKGANLTGESFSIVTAEGIRARQRTVTIGYGAAGSLPTGLLLRFADVDGYEPRRPLVVQWRMHNGLDAVSAGNIAGNGALVVAAGNTTRITAAERLGPSAQFASGDVSQAGASDYTYNVINGDGNGATGLTALVLGANTAAYARQVLSLSVCPGRSGAFSVMQMPDATSWPDPIEEVRGCTYGRLHVPLASYTVSQAAEFGFLFWPFNSVGTGAGYRDCTLRALRILQPGTA